MSRIVAFQAAYRALSQAGALLLSAAIVAQSPAFLWAQDSANRQTSLEVLNVSYEPMQGMWREVNALFRAEYKQKTGQDVSIVESHGASTSQAQAVINGLKADVVTLANWSDIVAIQNAGLIKAGWQDRLPNKSLPYYSTIVFVVRKGNPMAIHDWPDLIRPGVGVVSPDPATSGNGQLSLMAAWGAVVLRGGSEEQAMTFLKHLFRHIRVADRSADEAARTFAVEGVGDVQLAWESRAYQEVADSKGALEIVYPPLSIRAEPPVAVVDTNVATKGTAQVAEAYLHFLYSKEAQEIMARHHLRPSDKEVLARYRANFPKIHLFTIDQVPFGWDEAYKKFFAKGGVYDRIRADLNQAQR